MPAPEFGECLDNLCYFGAHLTIAASFVRIYAQGADEPNTYRYNSRPATEVQRPRCRLQFDATHVRCLLQPQGVP